MGCATDIVCYDCKKWYYLGYGSYCSWILAKTVAEYNEAVKADPTLGNLVKNQNLLRVLIEHEGHNLFSWIDDYEYGVEGGNLYGIGDYGSRGAVIIKDISDYEKISLG